MSEPMVIKPSDKSLLLKIRDEYVKPNALVGTNAYLCSFLSQLADRIEQLESELEEAEESVRCQFNQLSSIQEQIKSGELVPAEHVISWFSLEKPLGPTLHEKFTNELKQFAAERAKEQG